MKIIMTNKHTPGPWSKLEATPAAFSIRAGQATIGSVYKHLGSPVLNDMDGQGEANAQLISAAPELLEALETLVNLQDGLDDGGKGIEESDWDNDQAQRPRTNGSENATES